MADLEDEIRDLREKNSELAQEVQFWKVSAGQKEKEKLELMREVNELRLKLSRLRSGGAAQALKLDSALQSASEEALSHLVQASGAVARTIELAKQYIQERQELDAASPRWSNLGTPASGDRVHKVPPLLLGGQSIQPVVSLSRTILNNRSMTRSPSQNSGVTHRAVPMHMLQDVYIPLTRIDAADLQQNNLSSEDVEGRDNSAEDLGLDDNEDLAEESQNLSSVDELEESRRLDAVIEDLEPEDDVSTNMTLRLSVENPMEGPSWLLDGPSDRAESSRSRNRINLEPDSTTPSEDIREAKPNVQRASEEKEKEPCAASLAFTPTVRRRKRASSPPPRDSFSPRPHRHSNNRELKVVVTKLRMPEQDPGGSGDSSPPKRPALNSKPNRGSLELSPPKTSDVKISPAPLPRFDAPSPNGATDIRVIVEDDNLSQSLDLSHAPSGRESRAASRAASRATSRPTSRRDSRAASHSHSPSRDCSDSDSSSDVTDSRTRRTRKQVSYKEKPLNRKLRR